MAFVNMFNDRVEQFNLREENERLAELFSDEKLQEEAQWQAYSVKEISRLFSISEEEALKLMNCGLFKTYRVGNEYRASKKSVEENKKIVKAVLTYQDKKTMSVPDVMRILGLGKTATYRLINQCRFKTYLVLGKMRVDVDSFEDWYAGQFHYEKVNGERPGKKYGKTLSPLTVAKVLGIPRSTANDLMNDGIVEFIWVDGKRRIKKKALISGTLRKVNTLKLRKSRRWRDMSIEDRVRELNGGTYTKKSYSVEEVQSILGITRQTVYKLIKQGCFQAVMLETGYRIIKTSFDKWLDNE